MGLGRWSRSSTQGLFCCLIPNIPCFCDVRSELEGWGISLRLIRNVLWTHTSSVRAATDAA